MKGLVIMNSESKIVEFLESATRPDCMTCRNAYKHINKSLLSISLSPYAVKAVPPNSLSSALAECVRRSGPELGSMLCHMALNRRRSKRRERC